MQISNHKSVSDDSDKDEFDVNNFGLFLFQIESSRTKNFIPSNFKINQTDSEKVNTQFLLNNSFKSKINNIQAELLNKKQFESSQPKFHNNAGEPATNSSVVFDRNAQSGSKIQKSMILNDKQLDLSDDLGSPDFHISNTYLFYL